MDCKETTTYLFGFKVFVIVHKLCTIKGIIHKKDEYYFAGIKYKTITKPQ